MHIDVHRNAEADIERLWSSDYKAAAAVVVVLQELQQNPALVDRLGHYGDARIGPSLLNVKRWESARQRGNLWRFRILNTPATSYRVVYGRHLQTRQVCVLAVVHKDEFDYDDPRSDLNKRIFADWAAL